MRLVRRKLPGPLIHECMMMDGAGNGSHSVHFCISFLFTYVTSDVHVTFARAHSLYKLCSFRLLLLNRVIIIISYCKM